jgi:hypothetical protein
MYCKWCGMESKDDKRCEWCGRPLVAVGGSPGADAPTAVIPQATVAIPEATKAIDPVAQDTYAALPYTPRMPTRRPLEIEVTELDPFSVRLEKYLGIMLAALAAGMLIAHYFPEAWLAPFLLLVFASGILMGSFRVIGYYDDEFSDVAIVLIVTMFVGPLFATLIYLVLGLLRQNMNFSILGLMASLIVIRLTIGFAAHGLADTIGYMLTFSVSLDIISRALQLLPTCVLCAGWMAASFFRPLNE